MVHKFKDDNKIGKRGEKIFSEYLKARGIRCEDVSDNKEYQSQDIDFLVESKTEPGKMVSFEIKNDTRIAETGNIFFETMSNVDYSTDGCFSKTKANVMAIVSESERSIYLVSSDFLKKFVDGNKEKLRFIPRVPGSNSCGYLIPVKMLGENVRVKKY
jgi:Uncharacterized protein conserved in bacteria